jgi:hypothetical protein
MVMNSRISDDDDDVNSQLHKRLTEASIKAWTKIPAKSPSQILLLLLHNYPKPKWYCTPLSVFSLHFWFGLVMRRTHWQVFVFLSDFFFRVKLCNWHVQEAQLISEKRILELRVAELRLVWFDFYYQAS